MGVKEIPKFSGLNKNRNFLLSHMTVQREVVQANRTMSGSFYLFPLPHMLSILKVTYVTKWLLRNFPLHPLFNQQKGRKDEKRCGLPL